VGDEPPSNLERRLRRSTLNWRVPLHRGAIQFLARHFTVINLGFRDDQFVP